MPHLRQDDEKVHLVNQHDVVVASFAASTGDVVDDVGTGGGNLVIDITEGAYGAVADNATDNTTRIQAALDDCEAAGGGIVWVPPNAQSYKITGGLSVGPHTVFRGVNRKASQIHFTGSSGAAITCGDPNFDWTQFTPLEFYGGVRGLSILGNSSTNAAAGLRVCFSRGGFFEDIECNTIGQAFLLQGSYQGGGGTQVAWNGVHDFRHLFSTQCLNGIYLKGYNSDIRFLYCDILGKGGAFGTRQGTGLRMDDRTATCVFIHSGFQAFATGYSIETINTGSEFIAPREENNDTPIAWSGSPAWYTFIGGNGVFRNPGGIDDGDFWNGFAGTGANASTISWYPAGYFPQYSSLPAVDATTRGRFVRVPGASNVRDSVYYGYQDNTNTFRWKDILGSNGGTFSQTPGAVTTVTIPHALNTTPTRFGAQPAGANARGAPAFYLTADATNITLNFASALTAGTSYQWVWHAEV